jgi:hypothetical protein
MCIQNAKQKKHYEGKAGKTPWERIRRKTKANLGREYTKYIYKKRNRME